MAILSNINDLFRVDSAGAVYFGTSAGANLQVLQSVGSGGSPTWVTVADIIGGPYLPLSGGILTGATSTSTGISFTVGGNLIVNGPSATVLALSATTGSFSSTLTGKSATFVRDASGYSLRLDSADATTDNDLRFAKGGTDYAAIQIDAAATSDFQFYINDGTNWINTLTFARADGQATFTKLVSGITPTAAANFTTKAYVDAIDHGVTQITAGTNVTITPVGGTGNVTINANTQGDITALTLGNGLTGTSLTGPIPDVLMSGSYAGKFTIDSTGDVEYLVLNTTSTTSKRVRLQFTQNDNAGIELGSDYSNNGGTDFYFYDRVAGSVMFFNSQSYSFFPADLGIGITTAPSYRLHVSGTGYISGATLIGGTLTVTSGQIVLGGTGRIQGVDTVSVGTDAANKDYVDTAVAGVPQGDITSIVPGTHMTGTSLSGPIPTLNVTGTEASTVSTLAQRNSSGDINTRLFRSEYANQSTISGAIAYRINNSTDNYIRFCSDATAIRNFIGAGTSSTTGTVKGTGTATRVAFWSASDTLSNNSTFYWDTTNNRLAIGMTSTPSAKLHVSTTGSGSSTAATGIDVVAGTGGANCLSLGSTHHNWFPFSNGDNYYSAGIHNFRNGAHSITFATIASNSVFYNSVAIGQTAQPTVKLEVTGSNHFVTFQNTSTTANHYAQMMIKAGSATNYIWTANQNSTSWGGAYSLNIYTQQAGAIAFFTTAAERMRITSAGNVGIGTTAPGAKLDVNGTISASGEINSISNNARISLYRSTGTNYFDWSSGQPLYFSTETTAGGSGRSTKMVLLDNGNVGIGTTSPGYMLDVAEKIRMVAGLKITPTTSNLYATDGALSYYSASNGVYLNGAGASGWLRLQASGVENDQNSINIYGSAGNYMNFRTANSERMRIDSAGNVGIGTTSPSEKLHVAGGFVYNYGAQNVSGFKHQNSGGGHVVILNANDSYAQVYTTTSSPLVFGTSNAERMRITSTGNVGIGTTSPDTKLMVSGEILSENSNGGYFVSTRVPSSSSRPTLNFYGSALDINYVTGYAGGGASTAMTILSGGNVGIGVTGPSATLQVESVGGNGGGGDTDYQILAKNSTTSTSQQSTLGAIHPGDGYANLNLGSNVSGLKFWHISKRTSASSHRIEMYYNSGTFVNLYTFETNGTFTATGDIVAYSDKRLKSNIKTLDGSKVLKMRGVSFEKDGKKGSGVIAQELEKVAPELVHNELEYKGVAYGNLVGYLIEAIKELELRVKELENK